MTTCTPRFPITLLEAAPATRLAYFAEKLVRHQRLEELQTTILHTLQAPPAPQLILLYGPTGVGKTTLCQGLQRALGTAHLPALTADRGRLPTAQFAVPPPDARRFDWKDFYVQGLGALEEPAICYKPAMRQVARDPDGTLLVGQATAAASLRRAFIQSLRYRQPAALFIDEGQHLLKIGSGRRLIDQMDNLKWIMDESQTPLILVGTYELLHLCGLNGQLGRRSVRVEFGRYRLDHAPEQRAFQNVLWTFQQHLPVAEMPDFVGQTGFYYLRSLGCIGVLKDLLTRSLATALARAAPTLTPDLVEEHVDWPALEQMAREIHEGEAPPTRPQGGRASTVGALLGLPAAPAAGAPPAPPALPPTTPRPARRVGERRLDRDHCGEETP